MAPNTAPSDPAERTGKAPSTGFDVLDGCHRQTVIELGRLAALVARVEKQGADAEARALARQVSEHFSTVARLHHEDEERHVFPKLVEQGDDATVQAVLRLQQDHDWLEEDWMALSAHVDAIAGGQGWFDVDLLREGVLVFTALSHEHIALEESVIYPQARARLRPAEQLAMGREITARHRERLKAAYARTQAPSAF